MNPHVTKLELSVNGNPVSKEVEPRTLLSDFLRHELSLTGTHVGCEQGVCGACTVLMDGLPARSCLTLAIQCQGVEITTVEGLAEANGGELTPLQKSFQDCHALQCGFCTPGILMTLTAFLKRNPEATEEEIRMELAGNLCRCTGYQNIVKAALATLGRASEIAEKSQ
ncbi:(2Fe-2S)-binding protein [Pelagicoccus albus]|uniref:(2Fe-2S)-binding protein n=1 Tax=Pelagicoccus albus TaxID=415222 RepID=A0A7X1B3G1_9BACT|nr:(2Fe-2S)-binding protein [Pelagicoccus albus]MBC2604704.1 (2Fe-2S)-binding protein [Pelagicoccus albus]